MTWRASPATGEPHPGHITGLVTLNENDAGEVSTILAYLRQLQRAFDVAVVVVHHCRKNSRPGGAGVNLRGSTDFHAWSDSSLYLHPHNDIVVLTPEHRTAPAPGVVHLRLHAGPRANDTHFQVVDPPDATGEANATLEADVLTALTRKPLSRNQLRATLRVRNQRLGTALHRLLQAGRIIRKDDNTWAIPIPAPTPQRERNQRPDEQLSLIHTT